jgi:hypothetical protein
MQNSMMRRTRENNDSLMLGKFDSWSASKNHRTPQVSPNVGKKLRRTMTPRTHDISMRRKEMHDAIAEALLKESGTTGCAFAITAEVIFQAAILLRPLNRSPLDQVPYAKLPFFRSRRHDVPASQSGANNQRTTTQLPAFASDE